ncbi:SDR family NAD(P)-dependent oxidoreductase [Sphingobium subterraneum]|uniref:NAD(P)-dependent dehydrogenase (Short-subunit alcohol dehydrogenase family) n=1 Tax=Sphingobium subterraneum TaxID=627688 RepID=A0A841IY56_9SPHN|nr:SDR family NAD(P)-dependent oxidoreductase [Sphingobium subterraneum]MBB6123062.1 NAD(P)-dependent dehydrogenase (short-subunit alcohol dehydrogenase family) [Sphingobium subterraneum]
MQTVRNTGDANDRGDASEFWPGRYAGQSALIVGGTGGIGAAAARRLAAEGASVGILDLNGDAAQTLAQELSDRGYTALGYALDATDPAQVARVFDDFETRMGKIDVLVNMAGLYSHIEFSAMTLDVWRKYIAINLDITFVTTHDVLPRMIARGYGRISTVSSASIALGLTEYAGYIAGKSGVIGLTRVLARLGGGHNVTANTIMPGLIETSVSKASYGSHWASVAEQTAAMQSVPRIGGPEDIADGIAWICSRQARHITGQVLNIDGGLHFTD